MASETVSAPLAIPVEPTTPIKPSEAIRLGCLVAPVQDFGRLGGFSGGRASACVMGAMYHGFGGQFDAIFKVGEIGLSVSHQPCPAGPCSYRTDVEGVLSLPAHLNDDHRWTREHIADWLAGQGL